MTDTRPTLARLGPLAELTLTAPSHEWNPFLN
jgi:hypothetical protein